MPEIIRLFSQNLAAPMLITANMNMDFLHETSHLARMLKLLTKCERRLAPQVSSCTKRYIKDRKLCVRASTTLVHFDYSTHKPAPIPKSVRDILKEHVSVSS